MSAAALKGATRAMKAGAKIAQTMKNAVGAALKRASAALKQTVGPVLTKMAGSPLGKAFDAAVGKSSALAKQVALVAKRGGASMLKKFRKILGNNPKFVKALGAAKGVAAKAGAGLAKYTAKCAKSKRCAGAVLALAAVGFLAKGVKDRLDKLDEAEAQCMADCLPGQDPEDPARLVFKTASEDTPVVCDGTDETGDDAETCQQFCLKECTSVAKQCKEFAPFLPDIACDAAGAAAKGISGFPGNLLDGLGETFKTVLTYAAIALGALVGISLLVFIAKKFLAARIQARFGPAAAAAAPPPPPQPGFYPVAPQPGFYPVAPPQPGFYPVAPAQPPATAA
jgi:hypothetical protein